MTTETKGLSVELPITPHLSISGQTFGLFHVVNRLTSHNLMGHTFCYTIITAINICDSIEILLRNCLVTTIKICQWFPNFFVRRTPSALSDEVKDIFNDTTHHIHFNLFKIRHFKLSFIWVLNVLVGFVKFAFVLQLLGIILTLYLSG